MTGIERPERVQADSLVPLIAGEVDDLRDFVVTTWPMYLAGQRIRVVDDEERRMRENQPSTVNTKEWSMLYSVVGEQVELYDRVNDPKLENNIFAQNVDVAGELHLRFYGIPGSAGNRRRLPGRAAQPADERGGE